MFLSLQHILDCNGFTTKQTFLQLRDNELTILYVLFPFIVITLKDYLKKIMRNGLYGMLSLH